MNRSNLIPNPHRRMESSNHMATSARVSNHIDSTLTSTASQDIDPQAQGFRGALAPRYNLDRYCYSNLDILQYCTTANKSITINIQVSNEKRVDVPDGSHIGSTGY